MNIAVLRVNILHEIISSFHVTVLVFGKMMMEWSRRKQINQSPSCCRDCAIFSPSHWLSCSTSYLSLAEHTV